MDRIALAAIVVASSACVVSAQTFDAGVNSARGADATMTELLSKDYEIKSAVPNGSKLIVFMQKGKSGYACEFVNVANTRCASIN